LRRFFSSIELILEDCQTTIDKSTRHLEEIDEEINEVDKGFCLRLCCSKRKKNKQAKEILPKKSSEEKIFEIENNSVYSNAQLRNLDENLQKLQFFNHLIDQQIQQQNQTIVRLKAFLSKKFFVWFKENSSSSS